MKNEEILNMLKNAIGDICKNKNEKKRLPYLLLTSKNEKFLQSLLAFEFYEKKQSECLSAPEWKRFDIALLESKEGALTALFELKIANRLYRVKDMGIRKGIQKGIQHDLKKLREQSEKTACYFVLFSLWAGEYENNKNTMDVDNEWKNWLNKKVIKYEVGKHLGNESKEKLIKEVTEFLKKISKKEPCYRPYKIGLFLSREIELLAWIIEM